MKTISVIGMGYIGLPTALLIAGPGKKINCIDKDKKKINNLKNGKIFLNEKPIVKLFNKKKKFLKFSDTLLEANIYIVCVPTPVKKVSKYLFQEDLSILYSVFKDIESKIKKNDLIILESTCPPNTAIKLYKKLSKNLKINFANCPERAMPGSTLNEMINNYRVIGASSENCFKMTKNLYKSFVKGEIYKTGLTEAELIKLFENSYRDLNVGFANELDSISNLYNVSSRKIIKLANYHPRVNIHEPGIGVGGHCIPVDPWFLIRKKNSKNSLILSARISNLKKEEKIYTQIFNKINKNKKNLFFGVTYKKNTDDTRNSPAKNIINKLKKKFPNIYIFDPINKKYNNISTKSVKSIKFENLFILVNHDWLSKNKIKSKKIISF